MVSSSSHWVADTLKQEGTLAMTHNANTGSSRGAWVSYIISCSGYPAPGTLGVCDGNVEIEIYIKKKTLMIMYTASNFYMTVQMSHVSLLFMRTKLIRNNNLPSELGAEHVLEAVAERGCSQSFCRSEQRHPSLPFLTAEVSAGLTHLLAVG